MLCTSRPPRSATAIAFATKLGLRGRRQRGLSPLETRGGLHLTDRVSSSSGAWVTLQPTRGIVARRMRPWLSSDYSVKTNATPGAGATAGVSKGVYISEFADAFGTGNYIYEYVEIFADPGP